MIMPAAPRIGDVNRVFAPGYGEFFTAHDGDVEALALAVPTDALPGRPPSELTRLLSGANAVFAAAAAKRWRTASTTIGKMVAAWDSHRARGVPPRLVTPTTSSLRSLSRAVELRNRERARHAALT